MSYSHLKFINVEEALELMGGYKQIYLKVIQQFIENNATIIEDLEYHLKEDLKEARRLVHSCKGIARNIGSHDLYEVSKEFELAILNNEEKLTQEYLKQFKETIQGVMADLKQIK
jgi:HPt (histidine-containing phosphotransfer) domain-containing protein